MGIEFWDATQQQRYACAIEFRLMGPWTLKFGTFWQRLTDELASNMEGRKFSHIHNPTIQYFHRVLAHTIFGWGDSIGNVNSKELYFINAIFRPVGLTQ